MTKILFISHDTTRTGAPLVLLNLLKWLKINTDIHFETILRDGGELEADFRNIGPVTFIKPHDISEKGIRGNNIKKRFKQEKVGLIYSNTITNGKVLEFLSDLKCHVICHVHELESSIQKYGRENFERVKNNSDLYIAASNAVKENLIKNHAISRSQIRTIYSFISGDALEVKKDRKDVYKELNISENSALVCASGTMLWRKAPDIFVQLANCIKNEHGKNVFFLWIGGQKEGAIYANAIEAAKKFNLEKQIRFLEHRIDHLDYINASDVFALVSREDSFPLICLEAAALGKAITCFYDGGGAKEFIEDNAGVVVAGLNVEMMALKIIELLDSSKLRQQLGQIARQKVEKRFTLNAIAPKILGIIKNLLNE